MASEAEWNMIEELPMADDLSVDSFSEPWLEIWDEERLDRDNEPDPDEPEDESTLAVSVERQRGRLVLPVGKSMLVKRTTRACARLEQRTMLDVYARQANLRSTSVRTLLGLLSPEYLGNQALARQGNDWEAKVALALAARSAELRLLEARDAVALSELGVPESMLPREDKLGLDSSVHHVFEELLSQVISAGEGEWLARSVWVSPWGPVEPAGQGRSPRAVRPRLRPVGWEVPEVPDFPGELIERFVKLRRRAVGRGDVPEASLRPSDMVVDLMALRWVNAADLEQGGMIAGMDFLKAPQEELPWQPQSAHAQWGRSWEEFSAAELLREFRADPAWDGRVLVLTPIEIKLSPSPNRSHEAELAWYASWMVRMVEQAIRDGRLPAGLRVVVTTSARVWCAGEVPAELVQRVLDQTEGGDRVVSRLLQALPEADLRRSGDDVARFVASPPRPGPAYDPLLAHAAPSCVSCTEYRPEIGAARRRLSRIGNTRPEDRPQAGFDLDVPLPGKVASRFVGGSPLTAASVIASWGSAAVDSPDVETRLAVARDPGEEIDILESQFDVAGPVALDGDIPAFEGCFSQLMRLGDVSVLPGLPSDQVAEMRSLGLTIRDLANVAEPSSTRPGYITPVAAALRPVLTGRAAHLVAGVSPRVRLRAQALVQGRPQWRSGVHCAPPSSRLAVGLWISMRRDSQGRPDSLLVSLWPSVQDVVTPGGAGNGIDQGTRLKLEPRMIALRSEGLSLFPSLLAKACHDWMRVLAEVVSEKERTWLSPLLCLWNPAQQSMLREILMAALLGQHHGSDVEVTDDVLHEAFSGQGEHGWLMASLFGTVSPAIRNRVERMLRGDNVSHLPEQAPQLSFPFAPSPAHVCEVQPLLEASLAFPVALSAWPRACARALVHELELSLNEELYSSEGQLFGPGVHAPEGMMHPSMLLAAVFVPHDGQYRWGPAENGGVFGLPDIGPLSSAPDDHDFALVEVAHHVPAVRAMDGSGGLVVRDPFEDELLSFARQSAGVVSCATRLSAMLRRRHAPRGLVVRTTSSDRSYLQPGLVSGAALGMRSPGELSLPGFTRGPDVRREWPDSASRLLMDLRDENGQLSPSKLDMYAAASWRALESEVNRADALHSLELPATDACELGLGTPCCIMIDDPQGHYPDGEQSALSEEELHGRASWGIRGATRRGDMKRVPAVIRSWWDGLLLDGGSRPGDLLAILPASIDPFTPEGVDLNPAVSTRAERVGRGLREDDSDLLWNPLSTPGLLARPLRSFGSDLASSSSKRTRAAASSELLGGTVGEALKWASSPVKNNPLARQPCMYLSVISLNRDDDGNDWVILRPGTGTPGEARAWREAMLAAGVRPPTSPIAGIPFMYAGSLAPSGLDLAWRGLEAGVRDLLSRDQSQWPLVYLDPARACDEVLPAVSAELADVNDPALGQYPATERQAEVAEFSQSRALTLCWGPPGTGKSATIARTIGLMVLREVRDARLQGRAPSLRVLVCAPTYEASDSVMGNVVETLGAMATELAQVADQLSLWRVAASGRNMANARFRGLQSGLVAGTMVQFDGRARGLRRALEALWDGEEVTVSLPRMQGVDQDLLVEPVSQELSDEELALEEVIEEARLSEEFGQDIDLDTLPMSVQPEGVEFLEQLLLPGIVIAFAGGQQSKVISRMVRHPDLLVIDEASQVDLPLSALMLSAADRQTRVLVCGDDRQLAPVRPLPDPAPQRRSLMDNLVLRGARKIQLDVSFRSPPAIVNAWRSFGYEPVATAPHLLRHFEEQERQAQSGDPSLAWMMPSLDSRVHSLPGMAASDLAPHLFMPGVHLLVQDRGLGERRLMEPEVATLVAASMDQWRAMQLEDMASGLDDTPFGVVLPRRGDVSGSVVRMRQVNLMNASGAMSAGRIRDRARVDTVDRFQGQEDDVVISCPLPLRLERPADSLMPYAFYLEPRRLCVAFSRARRSMIVVLPSSLLTTGGRSLVVPSGAGLQGEARTGLRAIEALISRALRTSARQGELSSRDHLPVNFSMWTIPWRG